MKALKSLLAISILAVAGTASALPVTATITAQTAPLGNQTVTSGNAFTGDINVDLDTSSATYTQLLGLSLSNTNAFVTTNDYLSPDTVATYAAGSVWAAVVPAGGIGLANVINNPDGSLNVIYNWGNLDSVNSNGAGTFTGSVTATGIGAGFVSAAAAPWDSAELNVHVADDFATILAITLVTTERSAQGNATTTYTIAQATPEVPLPAAAWLFGSGLLGLAGTARRRRNSEAA